MRLIDADALMEATRNFCDGYKVNWTDNKVLSWIDHAPTIDAVPVVRCKDCEQSRETNMFGDRTVLTCGKTDYVKQPDGYCDEGERKDGDG